MELKTNYQYTYFIHPFIIKENRYQKYILKMLKDKRCNLKIFQREKDLKMYQYFLPKTREFLFSSFSFGNTKLKKLEDLPIETRAAILSKYECNIFEYTLKKDIQGKIDEKKGIFFNVQKIEVICFKTGICFLAIKTSIEDYQNFANILNFNYKFKSINQEQTNLDKYDNIRLQTSSFEDVETFREFITGITGANLGASKLDIDTERFLTYSYVCIDQSAWNHENEFEKIKHNFEKYALIFPADNSRNIESENIKTMSKWKYAKVALSKQGVMLFSSSADMNNYTILPDEYEKQYLYTYILNLYKKIELKKIEQEFKNPKRIKKARNKFIEFTKNMWIQEITEDETGTMLNHKIQEALETEKLFAEVKNKYDILYKDLNIEKNKFATIAISVVLVASLIFNILNFIMLGTNKL
ncbi:MAG: hypothetical protein V8R81_07640 [Clostridia bacterium]